MFCRFCGMQLNEKAMFCSNCGTKANGNPTYSGGKPIIINECKKHVFLLFIPIIYLVCSIVYLGPIRIGLNDVIVNIVACVLLVSTAFFWGGLSYISLKCSVRFTLLFLAPYLCYAVIYPAFSYSYNGIMDDPSYAFRFFGGIVLPFIVVGIIGLLRYLKKTGIFLGFITTVITMFLYAFYISICSLLEFKVYYGSFSSLDNTLWNMLAISALGSFVFIGVSRLIICVIYKRKMRKERLQWPY